MKTLLGKSLLKIEHLSNRLKSRAVKSTFNTAGKNINLEWPIKVSGAQYINMGDDIHISWNAWLTCIENFQGTTYTPTMTIKDRCYIGNHAHIVCANKLTIGECVGIADSVYIADNIHDNSQVEHDLENNKLIVGELSIGDRTWVGEGCCIFGNIKIGKRCVIAANSVVLTDIPDFCIAAGTPAKIIKRFDFENKEWRKTDTKGNFV